MRKSSNNTLRSISELAEEADVTRQTAYNWVNAGVVQHSLYVRDTPVFTQSEFEEAVKIGKTRKDAMNVLRPPNK